MENLIGDVSKWVAKKVGLGPKPEDPIKWHERMMREKGEPHVVKPGIGSQSLDQGLVEMLTMMKQGLDSGGLTTEEAQEKWKTVVEVLKGKK